MNKTKLVITLILIVLLGTVYPNQLTGQIRTHLPYSIFGIGELVPQGFSQSLAMGKTGIALFSDKNLNNLNPASCQKIDSISFFFDVGLNGDFVKYSTSKISQTGHDINLREMALGFRINRWWAGNIGMVPFSTVGYKIASIKNVEGTLDNFSAVVTGSGGLNRLYFDNSFRFLKKLSLGISISYIMGTIEKKETVSYYYLTDDIVNKETSYFGKVCLNFGFQYTSQVNNNLTVCIGGIYNSSHKLNYKRDINISLSENDVLKDEVTDRGTFKFPMILGGGMAFIYKQKLTVTSDYLFYNWSGTSSDNPEYKYKNANCYHIGAEFIPHTDNLHNFLSRIYYRAGLYSEGSYLKIEGASYFDNGLTFGLGLPFLKNKSSINIAILKGIRGTTNSGLIKENYTTFTVSLIMHDWWFIKPKYD